MDLPLFRLSQDGCLLDSADVLLILYPFSVLIFSFPAGLRAGVSPFFFFLSPLVVDCLPLSALSASEALITPTPLK